MSTTHSLPLARGAAPAALLVLALAAAAAPARADEPIAPAAVLVPPAAAPAVADRPPPPDWLYLEPHDYKAGSVIPPGYVLVEKRRRWPLVLGAAVFGAGYATAVAVGHAAMALNPQSPESWAPMLIPVAGPFVTIGTANVIQTNSGGLAATLGIFAVVQALGAGAYVTGLMLPHKQVLVPQTPYGEVEVTARRGPTLELHLPRLEIGRIPGDGGGGMRAFVALEGTFAL
jgi:hypothetical protein